MTRISRVFVASKFLSRLTYSDRVLATLPSSYFTLSDAPGTTQLVDSTGHSYATHSDIVLGEEGIGDGLTSIKMNGVGDIAIDATLLENYFSHAAGTFLIWCKILNTSYWSDGQYYTISYLTTNQDMYVTSYKTSDFYNIANAVGNSSLEESSLIDNQIDTADWFCTAMSWNAELNQLKSYLNGIPSNLINPFIVGHQGTLFYYHIGNFAAFPSWVAHAALWTRTLSDSEIESISSL